MRSIKIAAISLGLALGPIQSTAQDLTDERIKELALQAIRENPQIIMEAVQLLEAEQAAAQAGAVADVLENERDLLERDPNAPVLGNPDGDVTVVEFFDYNCPYCKRAMAEVQGLLEADRNVRLVYREWPILSEGSVFAAKAALAAREQGKYEEFHWALMGMQGRAEEASVLRVAEEIGLDVEQLRADMDAPEVEEHIATSMRLTQALGFNGTPSFVIGETLVPGFVDEEQLRSVVEETRDGG
ncbi:DsbA family protein [Pseudooceanicola sediminis]|uniref:DsbA family protein n=1 Tax=Pseudooceanicola sediminis TaxID=2211117 RepID=A0A399IVY4_9RHOB|nr:DsbA family protein [Pseudooceanicola sediminis]KAA2312233.1 DsbA family protein [Puniceibacterium sp. HSS470]RII37275.1 DsbA family protein [Pseudooceanicola sediminis]|tara:strand:- start:15637 stop:16365 length:729 start_codon:yes stop_codon:yes gene_type:complete